MSFFAGFDLVVEITAAGILKNLKEWARFGPPSEIRRQPFSPPSEHVIEFENESLAIRAHMLFLEDPRIELLNTASGPAIRLVFPYTDTFLAGWKTTAGRRDQFVVEDARGEFTIETPIVVQSPIFLIGTPIPMVAPVASFAGMDGTLGVTFSARRSLETQLAGSASAAQEVLDQFVERFRRGLVMAVNSTLFGELPLFPTSIAFQLSAPASLSPLRVTSVTPAVVNDAAGAPASFACFVMTGGAAPGDPSLRDVPAISTCDFTLAMTENTFEQLIMCPRIQREVAGTALPGVCGTAASVRIAGEDYRLRRIDAEFKDGHIDIVGRLTDSGFCYELTADFRVPLFLEINDVLPIIIDGRIGAPDVDMDIEVDFLCWVATSLIGGLIGIVVVELATQIIEEIVDDLVTDRIAAEGPGTTLFPAILCDVQISPEGLFLHGNVADPSRVSTTSSLSIRSEHSDTITSETERQGAVDALWDCMSGLFTLRTISRQRTYRCTAAATLIPRPLRWSLRSGEQSVALNRRSGRITLTAQIHLDEPFPTGSIITDDVALEYRFVDDSLEIWNVGGEGRFTVVLEVRASGSASGRFSARQNLSFDASSVESPEFERRREECLERLIIPNFDLIPEPGDIPIRPDFHIDPKWRQMLRARPAAVLDLMRESLRQKNSGLLEFLSLAHGSPRHALESPETPQRRERPTRPRREDA